MNCRKCGAKRIRKERAGVFHCRRCGYQPGPARMDRAGTPGQVPTETSASPIPENPANVPEK